MLALVSRRSLLDFNPKPKTLRTLAELESFLSEGITNALVHVMLDEDVILHLIEKSEERSNTWLCYLMSKNNWCML